MEEGRYVGELEKFLRHVRFAEFHWIELVLMAGVLVALVGYALLAWYLDRRSRARERQRKQLGRLAAWLEDWRLAPHEERTLRELAGDGSDAALYALLADPAHFEVAVQRAGRSGAFLERVRVALGYTSANAQVPIVSTRQLLPGDHFRVTAWEEGRPQHHYGLVTAVTPGGLALELTAGGFTAVTANRGEAELFYLRGNDLEYRFPFVLRGTEPARQRLLLAHQLVRGGQRPRGTRLPLVRSTTFHLHTELEPSAIEGLDLFEDAPAPARAQGQALRGVLLEMSEGGFSLVTAQPLAEGAYVACEMPLPRGRALPLLGRVLDCRPFGGSRWLARCELRGITPTQRNTLGQALRLELQRRLRAIQAERRQRRQEAREGG